MRNEDYFEMYKNKPLMDKIIAFGESIKWMMINEHRSAEISWRNGNREDKEYYNNEYHAHLERVNKLYEWIQEEVQELERKYRTEGSPIQKNKIWCCPDCGKRVQINHSHCHWCGKKISWK